MDREPTRRAPAKRRRAPPRNSERAARGRRAPRYPDDPVTQFALEVLEAGRTRAGELVRLACARHLRDLDTAADRGLVWKPGEAQLVFDFVERFITIEDGGPLMLSPDQKFVVGSIFGWHRADGRRRFETVFLEAAKGWGKSPVAALILITLLFLFSEPSAELFCAANAEDQASITFDHAKRMIEDSPALRRRVDIQKKSIYVPSSRSVLRTVSSEHRNLDGKKPSAVAIDEIQEYREDTVLVKMRKGTKGRRNPLTVITCNAGYGKESVSWRQREYSEKVLRAILDDDKRFAYIPTLDPCEEHRLAGRIFPDDNCKACDDWRDPEVWHKANPTLGLTIFREYLEREVTEAIGMPSQQNQTKRLNFNIWTEAKTRWLPMHKWDECAGPHDWRELRERVKGRPCLGGMDLAQVGDMSAVGFLFPEFEDDPLIIVPYFWVPEENILERSKSDGVHYDLWRDQGLLEATPGDVTDYRVIERRVLALAGEYEVSSTGYDRRFAHQIVANLRDAGMVMVETPQHASSISWACRELERLVKLGGIWHGGHPILRWNASNASVFTTADNQIRPDKSSETERIDGLSATVFALRLRSTIDEHGESIYARHSAEEWSGEGSGGSVQMPPPIELAKVRRRSVYASDHWKKYAKDHGYL